MSCLHNEEILENLFEQIQEEYPKDGQHCIQDYQPDLYYYWDSPIEEDYNWRDALPNADCLCEICFDILNTEKKIKWVCQ